MMETVTEESLKRAICSLTEVAVTNQGFEVTLPQIYHNGHSVVVVVSKEQSSFVVHDNSYAAMSLANEGISAGKRLNEALRPQVQGYGCELSDLRVWRRCESVTDLPVIMTLVGCASRLVADQALKADRPPLHDFKSSLLGRIVDAVGTKRVRTNEECTGHLGSKYRVSTVVLDTLERRPVAFVEPVADREAVARRFKEFYDISLNPTYDSVERVAVYDDANPLPSGDALLLEEVGNLVRFADTAQRFRSWASIQ